MGANVHKTYMPRGKGYRGYISSRKINNSRIPQHIQNLVVRDYAIKNNLDFKLSATEFAMPDCFLVLDGTLKTIESLDGIILYSLFMLPKTMAERQKIYDQVLRAGAVICAAVEDYKISNEHDVVQVENFFLISSTLESCPQKVLPYG